MKVVVGSTNPAKIKAVTQAFCLVFPKSQINVEGIEVESGVSKQPMSDFESIKGARKRARGAREKLKADFGVGLEGGMQKIGNKWFDCGWIVVVNNKNQEGIGSSIRMEVPKKMLSLIKKGKELGEVNDQIFNQKNSKHNQGHFGLMTNDAVTRISGYRDGVISALARFIQPEIF